MKTWPEQSSRVGIHEPQLPGTEQLIATPVLLLAVYAASCSPELLAHNKNGLKKQEFDEEDSPPSDKN